jgi:hypothetical protein
MLTKKYFEIVHHLMIIIVPIIFIILPLIYIKYIAWIPLALVITWVIFNGCIINTLHDNKANINTNQTDNVTPILKLFSKTLANYINKKYLQNTNRITYISSVYFILLVTIVCYRLIYNIDFIKLQSKQV